MFGYLGNFEIFLSSSDLRSSIENSNSDSEFLGLTHYMTRIKIEGRNGTCCETLETEVMPRFGSW